jgi:hypothetical protein
MKNIIVLLLTITGCIHLHATKYQDYIEIKFIGIQQKIAKQSFIINNQLEYSTIELILKDHNIQSKPVTEKDKKELFEMLYDTTLTDEQTFSKIISFINENHSFFSNQANSNYCIVINNKPQFINTKLQKRFFNNLLNYLKEEKTDKKIINNIAGYSQN